MGKFVIVPGKKGPHFVLKATNGQVIGVSEAYSSDMAAMNGIESIRKNVVIAKIEDQTVEGYENVTNPAFEVYRDKAGEFRFRLRAKNGEIVLTGESYKTKASCLNGIESIKKNAPEATVFRGE